MLSRLSFSAALLLSLAWVPAARAQAPAPAPSGAPTPSSAFPTTPPPAAPPPDDAQLVPPQESESAPAPARRKGFFATLQLGGGYFHASSGSSADPRTFWGGTVSGMLALGGRVGHTRRVALAGAFLRDQVYGLRSHDGVIDGDEPNVKNLTFGLWALGFLVDYTPQAEDGLHLQGLVGIGSLSVSTKHGSGDPEDPIGLLGSLGVGYDFRVSKDFTVGGTLRASYAPLDVDEITGTTVYIVVPALLLTATSR